MIGWVERQMRGTVPATLPYTDPLHAGRHPFQTFMLVFVVVSSLPIIAGQFTAGTMESALPRWASFMWGMALMSGAALGLVGSFWRGKYDTALLLERVGLNFAGFAAVVYGLLIPFVAGWPGLIAAAITVGFGASCLKRARDIAGIFARATELNSPRIEVEGE